MVKYRCLNVSPSKQKKKIIFYALYVTLSEYFFLSGVWGGAAVFVAVNLRTVELEGKFDSRMNIFFIWLI